MYAGILIATTCIPVQDNPAEDGGKKMNRAGGFDIFLPLFSYLNSGSRAAGGNRPYQTLGSLTRAVSRLGLAGSKGLHVFHR